LSKSIAFQWPRIGGWFRLGVAGAAILAAQACAPSNAQPAAPHTPAAGSVERRDIFAAMRRMGDDHTRVFVVRYLEVEDGWGWVISDPQSPDGRNHFETESALLHLEGGVWRVVDRPCSEGDCDPTKEMARIRAAHPAAPAAVFPH